MLLYQKKTGKRVFLIIVKEYEYFILKKKCYATEKPIILSEFLSTAMVPNVK